MVKNKTKLIFSVIVLILALILVVLFFRRNEDTWIKDSKGIYVMHGNPSLTPSEVVEQQAAISCASGLYAQENIKNITFNSQCLGTCGDYSIDIVHVPRTSDDDKKENQCADFLNKLTNHFIELNSQGQIVRIVD